MNTTRQQPVSEQGKTVDDHYSRLAENFYGRMESRPSPLRII